MLSYDVWKANAPNTDLPEEICDGGPHDLDEHAYECVNAQPNRDATTSEYDPRHGYVTMRRLLCSGCYRAEKLQFLRNAHPSQLTEEPYTSVDLAQRCGDCARYRCGCV